MNNILQDSMTQSIQNPQDKTYHEVLINIECKQQYLQDIITQSIADIILEHGDGVEFMDNTRIVLDSIENNA